MKVNLTKEQMYWIERTADLECAMAMKNFVSLTNNTDIKKLDKKESLMIKKCGSELIDLYIFLKDIRIKFELIRVKDGE